MNCREYGQNFWDGKLVNYEGFDIYPYLFQILTHKWRNSETNRTQLWFAVCRELVYQMRASLTQRMRILSNLSAQINSSKDKTMQQITLARLWFLALCEDLKKQSSSVDETFSCILLEDTDERIKSLVMELVNFPIESIKSAHIVKESVYWRLSDFIQSGIYDLDDTVSTEIKEMNRESCAILIRNHYEEKINSQLDLGKLSPQLQRKLKSLQAGKLDPVTTYTTLLSIEKTLNVEIVNTILEVYRMFRSAALVEWPLRAFGLKKSHEKPNESRKKGILRYLSIVRTTLSDIELEELLEDWYQLSDFIEQLIQSYNEIEDIEEQAVEIQESIENKLSLKAQTIKAMIRQIEKESE